MDSSVFHTEMSLLQEFLLKIFVIKVDFPFKHNHSKILKIQVAKWRRRIKKNSKVFASIHDQLLKVFAVDGGIKLPEYLGLLSLLLCTSYCLKKLFELISVYECIRVESSNKLVTTR